MMTRGQRLEGEDLALRIIESGQTDVIWEQVEGGDDHDLEEWLNAWGYELDDEGWVDMEGEE